MRALLALLILASTTPAAERGAPDWSDEFDTAGAPDPAKWDYEVGLVRNKEAQFYTRARPENAVVEDGHLVITARKEAWSENGKTAAYTSASVITLGKHEFQYGRVEVRAKLPAGLGMWPAIWFLGSDRTKVGWPKCGEIDLMEYVGHDPDRIHCTVHSTTLGDQPKHTSKGTAVKAPDAAADWHVYALELHRGRMEMELDGKTVFTCRDDGTFAWPFDKPVYLILNLAVGGSWGGKKGIDDTRFPQRMLVDYVRAWKTAD